MKSSFLIEFEKYQKIIDKNLNKIIKKQHITPIYKAMGYSLVGSGKRIRPVLLLGSNIGCNGKIEEAVPFACAIEMIHTYSLIHDDLPSMDNDDFRRGKLTNHKVFGDALAILAGDGLLNLAYEYMLNECIENNKLQNIKVIKEIANAAGVNGLIGGQVLDILSENKKIDDLTIKYIHENKTGALITASLVAGAMLANAQDDVILQYKQAGYLIGTAFQIKDDLLELSSTDKELGKSNKSDLHNNKSTYITVFGVDKAKDDFSSYSQEAIRIFKELNNPFLEELTNYLINRKC